MVFKWKLFKQAFDKIHHAILLSLLEDFGDRFFSGSQLTCIGEDSMLSSMVNHLNCFEKCSRVPIVDRPFFEFISMMSVNDFLITFIVMLMIQQFIIIVNVDDVVAFQKDLDHLYVSVHEYSFVKCRKLSLSKEILMLSDRLFFLTKLNRK